MSLHDQVERLGRSLLFAGSLMQKLGDALRARRTAWLVVRPSDLEQPLAQLDRLVQEIAAAAQARDALLEHLGRQLGLSTGPAAELDIGKLVAALPPALAAPLRRAATQATAQADKLRLEVAVGDRLLQFSRRAHEGFLQRLLHSSRQIGAGASGYGRDGRAKNGALVGAGNTAGNLIDGRL